MRRVEDLQAALHRPEKAWARARGRYILGGFNGIFVVDTSSNKILRNSINSQYNGIELYNSIYNEIFLNRIMGNGQNGLLFSGSSNTNFIYENRIYQNRRYGIELTLNSAGNRIYMNVFERNRISQAYSGAILGTHVYLVG